MPPQKGTARRRTPTSSIERPHSQVFCLFVKRKTITLFFFFQYFPTKKSLLRLCFPMSDWKVNVFLLSVLYLLTFSLFSVSLTLLVYLSCPLSHWSLVFPLILSILFSLCFLLSGDWHKEGGASHFSREASVRQEGDIDQQCFKRWSSHTRTQGQVMRRMEKHAQ